MISYSIQVTKHIIAQCRDVGGTNDPSITGRACPIAVAVRHIFPDAYVSNYYIFPYGELAGLKMPLPQVAIDFVRGFDSLCEMPKVRLLIPAIEFEIPIPDEVIEKIDIESDVGQTEARAERNYGCW